MGRSKENGTRQGGGETWIRRTRNTKVKLELKVRKQ